MIRGEFRPKWWSAVVVMASLWLAHVNLLWSDEDYHLAAAIQVLQGRVPYRDFWYDKPPLAAYFYALIGGLPGWPLRLLDAGFVLACCWFAYKLAKSWWSESEGRAAALLLAFFSAFYLPAATIPFAVDGLLLLPHLAAIYFAQQRRAFWCGMCCALGLLTNVKAIFVLATCAIWLVGELPLLVGGLAVPLGGAAMFGWAAGALPDFYNQVWRWGLIYAKGSATPNAVSLAVKRCADWMAFHAALLAGAIVARRDIEWRLAIWLGMSCAALFFGNHFAPRYFLQLLPVMVMLGARGAVLGTSRYRRLGVAVLALLLVVPLVRFGPRYLQLIRDNVEPPEARWQDAAMDVDSQQVALIINGLKQPGDTLFVWGYRPDDYVYTRLSAPGKFWDSQPLDGVPADRHLVSGEAVLTGAARENRASVIQTKPSFIVDGLGLLNPALAPERFPEIAAWLKKYRLIRQTKLSRIYQRN